MTRIKFCGLTRREDIETANELMCEYIGFVFWEKSSRYVPRQKASELKSHLSPLAGAVGVFVDEDIQKVAALLNDGIIDIAQLHGSENDIYISKLREAIGKNHSASDKMRIIKAFRIGTKENVLHAVSSAADMILLDSGSGSGRAFDWELVKEVERPYFLAGGLNCSNVADAVKTLSPYAVDVSSGIETDKLKDPLKMKEFADKVRSTFDRSF